jgi:hypothetical protein
MNWFWPNIPSGAVFIIAMAQICDRRELVGASAGDLG